MDEASNKLLEEFKKDRNEALLSMDETKIRAFLAKYSGDLPPPKDPEVFWAAVHKAITGCKELPMEHRSKSKKWLTEHNYHSWDDGDVSCA